MNQKNEEKLTGLKLAAVWILGIAASWSLLVVMLYGIAQGVMWAWQWFIYS